VEPPTHQKIVSVANDIFWLFKKGQHRVLHGTAASLWSSNMVFWKIGRSMIYLLNFVIREAMYRCDLPIGASRIGPSDVTCLCCSRVTARQSRSVNDEKILAISKGHTIEYGGASLIKLPPKKIHVLLECLSDLSA